MRGVGDGMGPCIKSAYESGFGMIVYACMCEQMLDCEYVIILKLCVGAMQFSPL